MVLRWVRGLALLFTAVFLTTAPVTARAAETTKLAPPGAPFDIDRGLRHAPQDAEKSWQTVWSAHILFGPSMGSNPRKAELHLQGYMIRTTTEIIAQHAEWLHDLDWNPRFSDVFKRARAWRRDLNAMTMDQVYEVRNSLHRLAKMTQEKSLRHSYDYLASGLDHLLFNLNHMPTLFEFAVEKISRDDEIDKEDGYAWIQFLANEGNYAPAQVYGAQLFLRISEGKTSTSAKKMQTIAYFWLRRAVKSDPSVRRLLRKARSLLTPAQIEQVETWLRDDPR